MATLIFHRPFHDPDNNYTAIGVNTDCKVDELHATTGNPTKIGKIMCDMITNNTIILNPLMHIVSVKCILVITRVIIQYEYFYVVMWQNIKK